MRTGKQRPEFILGFAITPDQAKQLFINWLGRNSWFRPGDLTKRAVTDKQRGVYLPFWHFAMLAQSRWSANIGEHWYKTEHYTVKNAKGREERRTRQVLKVEWFPLSGAFERYWFGHLVPAASGINAGEAKAIGPYPLTALSRYRPYFLAGWMSEEYNVSRASAEEQCRTEFQQRQSQEINRFLPGDTQRGLTIDTRVEMLESDLVLLPVYVLSYRYRGKQYRFLVNGTNGKVVGQKPWSAGRIAAVVIAIVAILAILVVAASLASS